ncbi:YjgN family protein [Thauera sp.]|uniref:YjgN family protein n=1 Tax=Thauera sp. TaxID=1905334 RepID=UPI0039E37D7F
MLLSIVTLGIYSAWAKVRTQRYFYGNTSLDGSSFEYLATPKQLLKGRLIALVFFVTYAVVNQLLPLLGLAMMLLLMLAMPWIVVRSLAFRNHHSAWRGVRFGFDGKLGEAARFFLLWPLAGFLTLGILLPLAMQRQQRFLVENTRYGTSHFGLEASVRGFYRLYLGLLVIIVASMVVGFLVDPGLAGLIPLLIWFFLLTWFKVRFTNLVLGNTVLGGHRFATRYKFRSYALLALGNTLGVVLTLGLFYPWAKVRNARYAAEHTDFIAEDDLAGFVAAQRDAASATGGEVADLFDVDIGL